MAFLDNIYSGKYYRYKTMTSDEIPATRIRLQHLYFYNFLIAVLITAVCFVLVSVIAGNLLNIKKSADTMSFYKLWSILAPSATTTLILGFAFAALIRTSRLQNPKYVRHAIRSFPWVIGSVQGGLLLVNLDNDEMDHNPKAMAMAQLASISNITSGEKALENLLQDGPFKKLSLKKGIKSDIEAYYILSVCEILHEQAHIGNTAFFSSPTPLEQYIKINHQKEEVK